MIKKAVAAALAAMTFTTAAYAACDITVKNSQVTLSLSDFKGYNEVMVRVFREGFAGNDLFTAEKMTDVIAYQTQVTTDNKGKADVSFYLDKSGNYTIEVGEMDSGKTEKYELNDYADVNYSGDIVKLINEAIKKKDSVSIKRITEENYSKLNLNAQLYAALEAEGKETAYSLIANGEEVETINDFEKLLNTSAMLVNINALSDDETKAYIEKSISETTFSDSGMYKVYSEYMSDSVRKSAIKDMKAVEYSSCDEALEKYTEIVITTAISEALSAQTVKSALSACADDINLDLEKCEKLDNPMNVYQALCGGKYDSIEDVEKAFADAYDKQYEKENKKGSSGGGGGGGGGGGSVSAPTMIIRDPDTIKTESVSESITTPEQNIQDSTSEIFTDLTGYEWAKEDILALYNSSIVSGKGDNKFVPADNVTREEFVKMLTLSLGIYDVDASCEFSDVPTDAWYYSYVASAVNIGIVKGIDEASFGTGRLITREDAAVMINRAMGNLTAQTISIDSVTDAQDIADYALDSVVAMYERGILTGNADGSFKPKNNTTRAEAAVIISRMLKNM